MVYCKVAVLIFCVSSFFVPTEEICKDESSCVERKTHGLWSADCYNRNIREFPSCLRSDVKVIDLSYNRLRKITREDLSKYTNLQFLYLSDNLLSRLEDSTFQDMDILISLDLSLNDISALPPDIFQLPSLKKLYLGQNPNMNIIESIKKASPISSPLEAIDISFNGLKTLPNLGIMPHLLLYNITGNKAINMKVEDIAGLCNLKTLVNNFTTVHFDNPCDCWNIQSWLQERKVNFAKMTCEIQEQDCPYNIPKEDMQLYQECKSKQSELKTKSLFMKIGIPVAVVAVVLSLLLIYFLYKRRKQRRLRLENNDSQNHVIGGRVEDDCLL
ncbi:hypothetical protein ILUMI_01934 [Ignelater luminosus]|uniref:Uncharacterized protein n=1 Tax=Ignelater luminosus TaxID=2038154 RepID=A0A8K0DDM3_IGNLU|nr:hypothetical protein ILUMI_01934 [Ignelater luminosus]